MYENVNVILVLTSGQEQKKIFLVVIATVFHLFPSRTEKLSPSSPMVLQCNAGE